MTFRTDGLLAAHLSSIHETGRREHTLRINLNLMEACEAHGTRIIVQANHEKRGREEAGERGKMRGRRKIKK